MVPRKYCLGEPYIFFCVYDVSRSTMVLITPKSKLTCLIYTPGSEMNVIYEVFRPSENRGCPCTVSDYVAQNYHRIVAAWMLHLCQGIGPNDELLAPWALDYSHYIHSEAQVSRIQSLSTDEGLSDHRDTKIKIFCLCPFLKLFTVFVSYYTGVMT